MEPRVVSETTVSPRSTSFQCSNCSKDEAENTCSKCNAVKYCSRECQKDHWKNHKSYCNEIKKLIKKVEKEAKPLREYEECGRVRNLFEDSVGHFWGLLDPRNYCRVRYDLCFALLKCAMNNNSKLALELSLEHMLDLACLNRTDNIGIRFFIPGVLCALDEMQEAYDFLKWWLVGDHGALYDWRNVQPPYWNLKDEDIFEDLSMVLPVKRFVMLDVHFLVSLFFLKYKVMMKLEEEKSSYGTFLLGTNPRVGGDSPIRKLRGVAVVLQAIKHFVSPNSNKKNKMKDQLEELVKRVDKGNKYLIPGLLNSAPLLIQKAPDFTSSGCQNGAYSIVDAESLNWRTAPGIHSYMKELYVGLHGNEKAEENIAELPKVKVEYDYY